MTTFVAYSTKLPTLEASDLFRKALSFYLQSVDNIYPLEFIRSYARPGLQVFVATSQKDRRTPIAQDDSVLYTLGTPVSDLSSQDLAKALSNNSASDFYGVGAFLLIQNSAVSLQVDKFGFFPIYLSRGPKGIALSNRAAIACALAGNTLRVLPMNAIEWIVTDTNLDARELIADVTRLRPGELVRLEGKESYRSHGVRQLAIDGQASRDDALSSMIEAVRSASEVYGPLRCKLTGGYDSRLNLALARAADVDYDCFTFNHPCDDSLVAQEITRVLNLPHVLQGRPQDLTNLIALTEGCCGPSGVEALPSSLLYISGAGGAFNKLHYLNHLDSRACASTTISWSQRANTYLSDKRRAVIPRRIRYALHEMLDGRLRKLMEEGRDFFSAIDWLLIDRERSWFGRSVATSIRHTFFPLINEEFYRYGRTFSPTQRLQRQPHATLIGRLLPELSDVCYLSSPLRKRQRVVRQFPQPLRVFMRRIQNTTASRLEIAELSFENSCLFDVLTSAEIKLLCIDPFGFKLREILRFEQYLKQFGECMRAPADQVSSNADVNRGSASSKCWDLTEG